MRKYVPIQQCDYGELDPKVNLLPDFFTGFVPSRRDEIVKEEAAFYHSITEPYSLNEQLEKYYTSFFAEDGYEIPIKLYRPKDCETPLPILVFLHGGGFKTCSVETHDFVPSYIAAKAGIMAFSIEYRLAPENKFPRGLEDCYQSIQWIIDNAKILKADDSKIIVCGDSSGGTFSAAITLMARHRQDFKISKQVLIYPATEFTGTIYKKSAEVYTLVGSASDNVSDSTVSTLMSDYLLNPTVDVWDPLVSPMLEENLSNLPEALFIEAECDALLDDGLIYANLLKEAGVNVNCKIYKGMPHAFILRTYEETFSALDEICKFVTKN